jgi:undecaprenyl phosphate N,N'-diacetylbacillosamine 1-phosphate transferase
MYREHLKRLLDILLATLMLIFTSPFFLLTWFCLTVQNKGKAFFFQERPGLHEKPFSIIKFKTMTDARDSEGNLLPDAQRLTPLGKWVRKLSLDELPQLFNVFKGDMSLIGPRPLLFKYLPLYNDEQRRRHSVRPGITGWAQVNGRNSISWNDKFKHDIYYVDHISLSLDMKILWMTVKKVIKREGINQSEERPMQPFTGNK